jgi:hypothetical protein
MNKKRVFGVLFILSMLFVVSLTFAQDTSLSPSDESYTCFEAQLGDNCGGTNNAEQASFNLLAIGYDSGLQSDCKNLLKGMMADGCWGESDGSVCNIKSTALATLALNNIGEDVDNNIRWLLQQKIAKTGLTWYLEIDSDNETRCTVNGQDITVQSDKKITGSDPLGLKKAYNNYWFEITDTNKNFSISCDRGFITSLLYKKPGSATGGSVYYVSSETQSASAHDSVTEKVESYCFGTGGKCDYEGSLWAVFALAKMDEETTPYLHYLSAMSDEALNKKYIPAAFLYILTGAEDYYVELINMQKQGKYWDESRNKFYDTSIALLALQGTSATEVDSTLRYLLDRRENSGCWSSLTSLILYSGWPKIPTVSSGGGGGDVYCEEEGYYCTLLGECASEDKLEGFACSLSETCCEFEPIDDTCFEKGGMVCEVDEECSMSLVSSLDESDCCLEDCDIPVDEDYCTDVPGYTCESSCSDNQNEISSYICEYGDSCCVDKPKEKKSIWLIVLLIILIILVVLAIIFRNQLKIWLFRIRGKFRSGKGPKPVGGRPRPGPGMPPAPVGRPGRPGAPRQIIPRRHLPVRRAPRRGNERDKDFDDTMKKLRDMSK